ncbi:MAG: M56 family metallopeptidase [Bacteroidetes bacterium]|nr:M56 family metallopeptidase [Bacteroidota bacterium]
MDAFVIYLIQSALCLGSLYLIYWFFLKKDTFFTANRFYLISSIILSFVLPMFKVPVFYDNSDVVYVVALEAITVTADKIESGIAQNLTLYQSVLIVYLTGASIFLLRFIFQLLQLAFLIRKFGVTKLDGLKIVKINSKYSPFSYFNFIFLNEQNFNDKNLKNILDHEKIHIRQKHSVDLIILEALTIIQWFNPFIWLYKTSLKGIHEYLADEGLLAGGMNKTNYQNLLLSHTVGLQINDLTNNFNQSLIKKRFIMMTKMQSKKFARLKMLLVIPMTALLILCFTFNFNKNLIGQSSTETTELIKTESVVDLPQDVKKEQQQENIFTVVEVDAEYVGGEKARVAFLSKNIKYPEEARKNGIQGRVHVTFVVEKDGSITNVRIAKGIGYGCDEEAVRVIKLMPNWIPGKQRGEPVRVQFNLPIVFTLDSKSTKKETPKQITYVSIVDDMPKYEGGNEALLAFLNENIKYPEEARKNRIQGLVYVNFMVEKYGSITGVKVIKGIGGGCDEEAIRVVKLMKFKASQVDGQPIASEFNLPINFRLQ